MDQNGDKTTFGKYINPGDRLREHLNSTGNDPIPFIGVYDAFSASISAKHFDCVWLSGFGFSASFYGLPDIGFIAWSDIVAYVQRIRTILPNHHILVDIDDGYCDVEVAAHVCCLLEAAGASGIVLEDQKRPRKCGHFEGKEIMVLDDFLVKLKKLLAARRSNLFVVARTDSSDAEDIKKRLKAFADAGADALLVDGVKELSLLKELVNINKAHKNLPFAFNSIAGGKTPAVSLSDLKEMGIKIVIYSTPCLFAAQTALEGAVKYLKENDGKLPKDSIGVKDCTAVLDDNLKRRDTRTC